MTDRHLDSDSEFERWSRPPRTTPAVIDRRVLSNGEVEEWERPATIPDDFIYDPETNSYYPPGEPTTWDADEELRKIQETIEEVRREPPIPPEKLKVPPGTLYVPPAMRKSLSDPKPDLFSGLPDADVPAPKKRRRSRVRRRDEASADGDA